MRVCIAWPNSTDAWYTALVADLTAAGHTVTQVNPTNVAAVTAAYDGAGCNVLLISMYSSGLDYRAAVNAGRPCVCCDPSTAEASQWATGPTYADDNADADFGNSGHYIAGSLNNTADVALLTGNHWEVKWSSVGSLTQLATNSAFGTAGQPIAGYWDVGGTYGAGTGTVGARTVLWTIATTTGSGAIMNATGRTALIRALMWAASGNPALVSVSPADDATGVAVDANLVAVFDKTIEAGAGEFDLRDAGGSVENIEAASGTLSTTTIANDTITFNPTSDMAGGTAHHVLVDADAIIGFAGIASSTAWNFTTEAGGGDDTTADISGALIALEGSVSAALAIDATIAGSTVALVGDASAGVSIETSASGVLSGLTGDIAADLAIETSLAGSTLALAGDVSAELALSGAIDATLPGLTGAVAAELALGASVAGQLPGLVGAVSVGVSIEAAVAATLPLLSGAFAGVAAATLDGVLPGLVGQVAAELAISGAVAGSLPGLTGEAAARVGIAGTVSGELPGLTGDASAELRVPATVQATLPALQGAFDADVNGDTEATVGGVLPLLAAAAVAALAIQSSVDAGIPLLVGAFSEAVEVPVDPIPRLTATWTPGVRLSATHTPGRRLTATWSSSQ